MKTIKIAKIIDEFLVVINAGKEDSIQIGDVFEIYAPGNEIKDPDSGESLGTLDFVKGRITAKNVFPKMSVCENRDLTESAMLHITRSFISRPAELNIAAEDISGGFDEIDEEIRVGDLVRKTGSCKDASTQ